MKLLLLIIPLVLSLISCSEQGSEQGSEREINKNQLLERDSVHYAINEDKPYSGKVVDLYANGQLEKEGTYVNGRMNGPARMWYENGQLGYEGNLVNGEPNGLHRWYNKDGSLGKEETYVNGKEVK